MTGLDPEMQEITETTRAVDVEDITSLGHAAESYCLQPIALTKAMLLTSLYRHDGGRRSVEEHGEELFIAGHCSVDFNAFVNVFFEWHWLRHTGSTADTLDLVVEGVGKVKVIRTLRNGDVEQVAVQRVETGRTRIALPPSFRSPGTLSFVIDACIEEGLTIKGAVWSTRTPPRRIPLIDVAICTFNKLDMLRPSLEVLCRVGLKTPGIGRVIVVDQGSEKVMGDSCLGAAATDAVASGRLVVIEQQNLGGAGGFTRGIVEALRGGGSSRCTHVLLMDDDVLFEPRLLSRLVAFLSRILADAVVGGSMVDMMRPHHMFAYSERFNCETGHCERLYPNSLDLRDNRQFTKFEKAASGNYNGWFICCFPRSAFDLHGLPLPMFVRSDDCEFGLRLSNRGFPLVHMPALFVWHEPFWLKQRAWIEVYTLRNHLIVANVASQRYHRSLAVKRLGEFWYYIGTYQYGLAYACCMAIESYLEGPDSVFRRTAYWHERITSEVSAFEKTLVSNSALAALPLSLDHDARPRSAFHPLTPYFIRWPLNVVWNLWGRVDPHREDMEVRQTIPQEKLSWHLVYGFQVVRAVTADGQMSTVLSHDAAVARRLTFRMLKVTARLLWYGARRRKEYRNAVETYGSKSFWDDVFAPL